MSSHVDIEQHGFLLVDTGGDDCRLACEQWQISGTGVVKSLVIFDLPTMGIAHTTSSHTSTGDEPPVLDRHGAHGASLPLQT
jgi:hypothetical protein